PSILASSFVAGIAWALTGAELWLAGQRATPGWVRGRVNAFLMMAGQGGIALGSVLLAMGARNAGLDLTLCIAAAFALLGVGLGLRFSINFAATETPGSSAPEASTPDPKPSEMP
ncbi:MAG TPA: MFS transporter, partial [Terrimicrobiaceae bacterium]